MWLAILQVEGLDYIFQPKLIQEMELKLLQTIQWRLSCRTPYSYVELIIRDLDFSMKPLLIDDLLTRLTDFLLFALCLGEKYILCMISIAIKKLKKM